MFRRRTGEQRSAAVQALDDFAEAAGFDVGQMHEGVRGSSPSTRMTSEMTSTGEAPSGGVNRSLTAEPWVRVALERIFIPVADSSEQTPSQAVPLYSTMRTGKPMAARGPRRRSEGAASVSGAG